MMNLRIATALSLLVFICCSWDASANTKISFFNDIEQNDQEHELKLNNGKRWKANSETTTGVNNMKGQMNVFIASKNVKSVKDYNDLAVNLRSELTTIFTKCSMKGEAHNNLHSFLAPIFGYLRGLESDNMDSCEKATDSLNVQLLKYDKFFE